MGELAPPSGNLPNENEILEFASYEQPSLLRGAHAGLD